MDIKSPGLGKKALIEAIATCGRSLVTMFAYDWMTKHVSKQDYLQTNTERNRNPFDHVPGKTIPGAFKAFALRRISASKKLTQHPTHEDEDEEVDIDSLDSDL